MKPTPARMLLVVFLAAVLLVSSVPSLSRYLPNNQSQFAFASNGPVTNLLTCDSATFVSDVEAGGTIQFGTDCTDLTIASNITIDSSIKVDIEGAGHHVALDGHGSTQIFFVDGGQLNISGIILENGAEI